MTTITVPDCCKASPLRLLRSILAVLAGMIAIIVLSIATDILLHSLNVYPPWGEPMFDTRLCLLALSYRSLFTVAGGYLTARLAPHSPVRHAIILGAIGLVLGTLGGIAARDMGPIWFTIAIPTTGFFFAWLGGHLYSIGQNGHREP